MESFRGVGYTRYLYLNLARPTGYLTLTVPIPIAVRIPRPPLIRTALEKLGYLFL
jgi:hypothetical protein